MKLGVMNWDSMGHPHGVLIEGEGRASEGLGSGEKSSEAMLSSTLRNSSCFRFRRLHLLWWIFRRGYKPWECPQMDSGHPCTGEGDMKVHRVDTAVIVCSRMEKSSSSTKRLFWGTWAHLLPAASPTAKAQPPRHTGS